MQTGKLLSLLAGMALAATLSLSPAATAGEVTLQTMKSEALKADYRYTVYLPEGYHTSKLRYPVVYLLHGNGGDENDWLVKGGAQLTADALLREGRIPPVIMVMPGGGTSWWVDGNAMKAETALIRELIPHIDAKFRTINAREGRMIAGVSAGGLASVNSAFKYPDMFASAASLGGALYVPTPPANSAAVRAPNYQKDGKFDQATWDRLGFLAHWDSYKAKKTVVPIYLNSGDHDMFHIAYHSASLFQKLFEYQPGKVELRIVDGDHLWPVWRDTFGEALVYMTSFVSRPQADRP